MIVEMGASVVVSLGRMGVAGKAFVGIVAELVDVLEQLELASVVQAKAMAAQVSAMAAAMVILPVEDSQSWVAILPRSTHYRHKF